MGVIMYNDISYSGGGGGGVVEDYQITLKTNSSPIENTTTSDISSIMLEGNSRKSRNLLEVKATSTTINGVTFTVNDDGTVIANGTASTNTNLYLDGSVNSSTWKTYNELLEPNKQYRLVGCPSGGSSTTYELALDKISSDIMGVDDYGNGANFSGNSSTTKVCFRIIIKNGATVNNIVFKPMLVEKELYPNITYNDFEPHGLIIPSGDIVSNSANLLNPTLNTTTANGVTCIKNEDGTYTLNGTATSTTFFRLFADGYTLENGKKYRLVGCPSGGGDSTYVLRPQESNGTLRDIGSGVDFTYNASNKADYQFIMRVNSGYTCNNLVFKPMLTTDLSATYDSFVKYEQSQAHTDRPLLSINDIKNELIVNADGSGVFVERVKSVDLGSLTWEYKTTQGSGHRFVSQGVTDIKYNINNHSYPNMLCQKYNTITPDETWNGKAIGISTSIAENQSHMLFVNDPSYTDATSFKTAMNGIKLIYELTTPNIISLTGEEINILLSIKTFYYRTYIDTDNAPFIITYYKNNNIGNTVGSVDTKVNNFNNRIDTNANELNKVKTDMLRINGKLDNINVNLNTDDGIPFRFSKSEDGQQFGYIIKDEEGADTFRPFKSEPDLIGTYTGNKTIDVSAFLKKSDTVQNFMIDFVSFNGGNKSYTGPSTWKGDWTANGWSNSFSMSKKLDGTNLIISGASSTGGVKNTSMSETYTYTISVTYKVYHI